MFYVNGVIQDTRAGLINTV